MYSPFQKKFKKVILKHPYFLERFFKGNFLVGETEKMKSPEKTEQKKKKRKTQQAQTKIKKSIEK